MPRPRSSRRSSACSPSRSCVPAISAAPPIPPPAARPSRRRWDDRLMSLKIYGVARTRAFRALWIAEELGLSYEHVPIEIGEAGARKPEFLALNPNGRLPLIVDGDFVLTESLAITLYLAKKYAHGAL